MKRRGWYSVASGAIAVGVFCLFQFWSFTSNFTYKFPLPIRETPSAIHCVDSGASPTDTSATADVICCPGKGVTPIGFPFRANLYDQCQQEGDARWGIQLLNYTLQIGFVVLLFFSIRRLLSKLFHPSKT